jgi:hypothetical protein
MLIWLLVVIVLLSLAGLGYRQGGIRVAMSFLGILFGFWLAGPLSGPFAWLLKLVGVKNPIVLWMLPPVVVFCVVNAAFKFSALFIHKKAEVFYRYRVGDLKLVLWERLMARTGLCLGVLNGAAYLVLLSMVIHSIGYWTTQVGAPDQAGWPTKIMNRLAWDLDRTGFSKTARAMDPFPDVYYQTADVAGLIYQNSLLEARLSRYPAFLILGESPAFQKLGEDTAFTDLRLKQAPLGEVLAHPNVEAMLLDANLKNEIWSVVEPNLDDLENYLVTGISQKYSDERIYGRWNLNASASAAAMRRVKPNMSSREMTRVRAVLQATYANAKLIGGTENVLIAKGFAGATTEADPNAPPAQGGNARGEWRAGPEKYRLLFNQDGTELRLEAEVQGERMTVTGLSYPLVFDREA